jgi:UTP--glucose-1-phosphate uridylyltransferase
MAYGQGLEVENWHSDSQLDRVLASLKSQWRRWQNVVKSMSIDPETVAEVASEDLQLLRDNVANIVLTVGGIAGVSWLFAEFAPEIAVLTTEIAAVSPRAQRIIEGIKKLAAQSPRLMMVANAGVHLEKWFWAAWTAQTPDQLKAANKKFIDLLVVIAAAPTQQRAGATWRVPAPSGGTANVPALRTGGQTALERLQSAFLPGLRTAPATTVGAGTVLLPNYFAASNNDGLFTGGGGPSSDFGAAFEPPSLLRPESVGEVSVNRSRVDQMIDLVPADMLTKLKRFGFDEAQFAMFAERAPIHAPNTVTGEILPLAASDLSVYPLVGTPDYKRLFQLGEQAIERGEVGVIFIAGGMATRYKGVVKAAAPVAEGQTFLTVKAADARATSPNVPIFVMTSAATHEGIVQHAAERGLTDLKFFPQFASLRFTPTGELFFEKGQPSLYSTGHGDLIPALRVSGELAQFLARGGKYLLMSNIDNLPASLDPVVIGSHIASGADMTAEVVRKRDGDAGGAPARVNGRPQIVESFRFPASFPQHTLPHFNPNTFVFTAQAIDRDFPFTFFRVAKTVDGEKAIQFEQLVGQVPEFLDEDKVHFLEVPRTRFLPIKVPEDLKANESDIRAIIRRIFGS